MCEGGKNSGRIILIHSTVCTVYIQYAVFVLLAFWTYTQLGRETEFERKSSDFVAKTVWSRMLAYDHDSLRKFLHLSVP